MTFRSALSNRGYLVLWIAQVASKLGDSVHEIAMVYLIYEVTGDPTTVAIVVVASVGPSAVFSPISGAIVDRINRKYVLVVTEAVRGLSVLAIPLFGQSDLLVPVVVTVAFVAGMMQAFFGTARSAVIPNLVDESDLDSANALSRMTQSAARLLYAAGGIVVAIIGPFGAFYVDAASFVVSAAILLALPTAACAPKRDDEPSSDRLRVTAARDVREGVMFVLERPMLLSLIAVSALTAFALGPFGVVLPFLAEQVSGIEGEGGPVAIAFGGLYAAVYAGVLLGGMLIGGVDDRLSSSRGAVIVVGVAFVAIGLVSTALAPQSLPWPFVATLVSLTVTGAAIAAIQIPVTSLAQTAVPDEQRGRLFSLMRIPALVASPVSVAIAGPLLERYGVFTALLTEGVVLGIVAFALLFTPLWQEYGLPSTDQVTADWRPPSRAIRVVALFFIGAAFVLVSSRWGFVAMSVDRAMVVATVGGLAGGLVGVAVEWTDWRNAYGQADGLLGASIVGVIAVSVVLTTVVTLSVLVSWEIAGPVELGAAGVLGVVLSVLTGYRR